MTKTIKLMRLASRLWRQHLPDYTESRIVQQSNLVFEQNIGMFEPFST